MKHILFFAFLSCLSISFGQTKAVTEIVGYAPAYVGKEIEIYQILDFFTMREEKIASSKVNEDSTFTLNFFLDKTKKLKVYCNNNGADILCEPSAKYKVFMPDRNKYDPYRPAGNYIEFTFYDLLKEDINYKILGFDRGLDQFLGRYYTRKNMEATYFANRLDSLKMDLEKLYKNDTADVLFNYHRKYSVARLEDLRFLGARNRFEKYDFFIKNNAVNIESEAYSEYIKNFYSKLMFNVSSEINQSIFSAIVKGSPTALSKSMGAEYTLKGNLKLRELVMVKILGDFFYEKDFPKTNILSILDSVSNFGAFPENRMIAKNMLFRLTQLQVGMKAPDFSILENEKLTQLSTFSGKHTYFIFAKKSSVESQKQLELLSPLYTKYAKYINFVLFISKETSEDKEVLEKMKNDFPFTTIIIAENDPIIKQYQVAKYPDYVLIDAAGYIVSAPALGPIPNGQYETIEKTFFQIQKQIETEEKQER